ncbi:MAG: dihydroxyacetone kinase subunit DhaK [Pseudomonadota bacterium]
MNHFSNAKEDIVQEAVDGLASASGGQLLRLDGYPFIRVVARADWDKSKVAIVSGGGSGHEPAHAGFVGKGMLTAAVCGDVFASPSVDAVLAGILAVTGEPGCLLIVKNYTGDRLNFGLAAERARALGLKVEMIILEDDIALPGAPKPRGVAGTLFAHKIAGGVADAGGTLADVTRAARRAATGAMTIGMSLDTCTIPGSPKTTRVAPGQIEMGLGIHGEAGADILPFEGARQAVTDAVARLKPLMNDGHYAVLLNNLGGTTALEMSLLATELINSSIGFQLSHIIGPAPMMTALDMHGFSISIYPMSVEDEILLAAPTSVSAWPGLHQFSAPRIAAVPDGLAPPKALASADPEKSAFIRHCCGALIAAEADLNALDAKTGDGDTGSTLATAARALLTSIDDLPLRDDTALLRAIGQELSQTMGGSSGVLLAILFSAAADASAKGADMMQALQKGLARMQEVGGAKLGDRTMVDALRPALEAFPLGAQEAATAARTGANKTASMRKAHAGRSAYLNADQLEGVIDPGAEAVARLFEAIAQTPIHAHLSSSLYQ